MSGADGANTQLRSDDGLPLNVLASPMRHADTVVFVNAIGISCRVAQRLRSALDERGLNFLTWDLRSSPGAFGADFRSYSIEHHLADLGAVMQICPQGRTVLASWCSGSAIALAAAAQGCIQPQAVAAFCVPNYADHDRYAMPSDTIEKVCAVIVRDEDKLQFYYDTLVAGAGLDPLTADIDDPELARLVLAPFKSGARATLHYAYALRNAPSHAQVRQWCRALTMPSRFYGGRRDAMVSHQDSVELARVNPRAQHKVYDQWTHYSLFEDTETVAGELAAMLL
jgi:pimeloyl-ACP methyl ester carboxylesterase